MVANSKVVIVSTLKLKVKIPHTFFNQKNERGIRENGNIFISIYYYIFYKILTRLIFHQ